MASDTKCYPAATAAAAEHCNLPNIDVTSLCPLCQESWKIFENVHQFMHQQHRHMGATRAQQPSSSPTAPDDAASTFAAVVPPCDSVPQHRHMGATSATQQPSSSPTAPTAPDAAASTFAAVVPPCDSEPIDDRFINKLCAVNIEEAEMQREIMKRYTIQHATATFAKYGRYTRVAIQCQSSDPWPDRWFQGSFVMHVSQSGARVKLFNNLCQAEAVPIQCDVDSYDMDTVHATVTSKGAPPEPGTVWYDTTVKPVPGQHTFDDIAAAIKRFSPHTDKVSEVAKRVLAPLGAQKEVENPLAYDVRNLSFMGMPDDHQQKAIKKAMRYSITPIQGPPGTGKTTTMVHLALNLVKMGERVLVVAQSNLAVVSVATKLAAAIKTYQEIQSFMKEDHFVYLASTSAKSSMPKPLECHERDHLTNRSFAADRTTRVQSPLDVSQKKWRLRRDKVYKTAKLVCSTLAVIGRKYFSGNDMSFDTLIMDEAGQINALTGALALVRTTKRVVLVGDHMQIRPYSLNRQDVSTKSLLETVISRTSSEYKYIRLKTQYRMHPFISAYISDAFYGGELTNGITHKDRISPDGLFGDPKKPSVIIAADETCESQSELEGEKGSFVNEKELLIVIGCVKTMMKHGVTPDRIAVLTFYSGQQMHLRDLLDGRQLSSVETRTVGHQVSPVEARTVDGFQGREKDYIILSCVRSSGPGFTAEPNRVNVALSRAKFGQVIVMNRNAFICRGCPHWDKIHQYHNHHGCIQK